MLRCAVVALLAVGAVTSDARASTADLFGVSSEESGVAGASTARVHDFSAGYHNPAGLVLLRGPEASVGLLVMGSLLDINGRPWQLPEPFGIVLGAAAPVPFKGLLERRIFVGVALYVLPDAIIRIIAHTPEEPQLPYYDNRTQRLLVLPSLAVRIGWGLSAGIAFNYLAGLGGRVVATEGTTRAVEARVDEQVNAAVAVHVGLRWQSPRDRVAVGLAFRQSFAVPFSTVTSNRVAGQPIDVNVRAEGLFTPHQLALGVAVRPLVYPQHRVGLQLSIDATVGLWSAWRGPFVTVDSELPIAGSLSTTTPRLRYSDTFALRLGAELSWPVRDTLELRVRAGLGFETSPIPASQPGVTNLLDGEKGFLAAGAGVRARVGGAWVRLDAHLQLHLMARRTLHKQIAPAGTRPDPATALRDELPDDASQPSTVGVQISNPGYPQVSGGGAVWALGATVTVER